MIEFWKVTPGGNPTILLRVEDVPPHARAAVAGHVMDPLHLGAEQVGFVRMPDAALGLSARLDMMGGEFCVNATRAFALVLAGQGLLPQLPLEAEPSQHRAWQGTVEVSGAESPVVVNVRKDATHSEASFAVGASLEFSLLPEPLRLADGLDLVRLPGIVHLVLRTPAPLDERDIPDMCAELRARYGLENEDAVGVMWLTDLAGPAPLLLPFVWVRETQSLCAESACGSGTLASALTLHDRERSANFEIRQPSGQTLGVALARRHSGGWTAMIGGDARLVAHGMLSSLS